MDVYRSEIQKTQEERKKMEEEIASLTSLTYDRELYSADRIEDYEKSIPVNDDEYGVNEEENAVARKMASYTGHVHLFKDVPRAGEEDQQPTGFNQPSKIIDREDEYKRRRMNRVISPERVDPFLDKTPGPDVRTYADVMEEEALKRQKEELLREIAKKKEEEKQKKRKTWDLSDSTPKITRWDSTPTPSFINMHAGGMTPELLLKWERDMEERNRPWTDEELDAIFDEKERYKILEPPDTYVPIRTPARKLIATPTPMVSTGYQIPEENRGQHFDVPKRNSNSCWE